MGETLELKHRFCIKHKELLLTFKQLLSVSRFKYWPLTGENMYEKLTWNAWSVSGKNQDIENLLDQRVAWISRLPYL